jgi:hypothetical protein
LNMSIIFKTSGELPIIAEEFREYTSNYIKNTQKPENPKDVNS